MSLDRIASVFLQKNLSNGQRFAIPTDDLMSRATLGQVLKGRVLRHIEGSRYSVEYHGQEKIVDSGVPLKTGELLYGRVVGLGDQIELERIGAQQTQPTPQHELAPQIMADGFRGATADLVMRLFAEFGANLNEKNAAVLQQALQATPQHESAVYAGVMLSKLGLPFTLERLDALTRALVADPRHPLFDERVAIYLATQSTDAVAAATQTDNGIADDTEFMKLLSDIADGSQQANAQSTSQQTGGGSPQDQGSETRDQRDLGYALLNLQTDGNIRHRVATIPLVINGELVELNIGLVEQREARQDQMATTHRRLVFTLNTDALGTLGVDGILTGDHLQLKFSVENADALELLDTHAEQLRSALEQANYRIDVIRHDVVPWQDMPSAAWLAAHTVIRNDSLDRRL